MDLRDHYRPHGGASQLTLRRVVNLAEGLPPESRFWSEVEDRYPVSEQSAAIGEIFQALTGEQWSRWNLRKQQRADAEFKDLLEIERAIAREYNAGQRKL